MTGTAAAERPRRGRRSGGLARPHARGRAVAPIIATLLLVAITVVLAAVLYVLIVGDVHSGASQPLESSFYAGPAEQVSGSAHPSTYCAEGRYCYAIPVDEASDGLKVSNLAFQVTDSTGRVHTVSMNSALISLVGSTNSVLASSTIAKNKAFETTAWERYGGGVTASSLVSNQDTIWIQFGSTKTSPFGQGHTLEVLGVDGYSGEVSISLP
ncbi:MAG TPA: archaellin/type IV pilin N-terminal domain-containing protein [Thermoplasmata archaeon]|nr:archaellin/type IV pilin N-terminal domain-containing protein [Thermoplasmata archaeon]